MQKYISATSDFTKSIQTDINHYVIRDRINDTRSRQKLDLISKNILTRKKPPELVFEDISTFDAKNPIVGSLLREVDLKKQTDTDFIKSLPSQPVKEFEKKKRLDKLHNKKRLHRKITITTITMMEEVEAEEIFSLLVHLVLKIKMIRLSLKCRILTIFLICCLKSMICDKD